MNIEMANGPRMDEMQVVNEDDRYICKALLTDADTRDMAADAFPMGWNGVPLGLVEWMAHNRRVTK